MLKIRVICFGKLKTPGLEDAKNHFAKMLSRFAELEEIELKPAPSNQREIEEKILLEAIGSDRFVLLDETGKSQPTASWSKWVQEMTNQGSSRLVFCIGGSQGCSDILKKKATHLFSFGPQTVSHELARVLLIEQLFRAVGLLNHHPYHHS